jgi:hypothetical protein
MASFWWLCLIASVEYCYCVAFGIFPAHGLPLLYPFSRVAMETPSAFTASIEAPAYTFHPSVCPEFADADAACRASSFASDGSDTKGLPATLETTAFVDALALAIKKSLGIGLGISLPLPDNDSGMSLHPGLILCSSAQVRILKSCRITCKPHA